MIVGIAAILMMAGIAVALNNGSGVFAADKPEKAAEVIIPVGAATKSDNWYEPQEVEITVGDTVIWKNEDGAIHTATADDGSFDSEFLFNNDTWIHTFTKPGVYLYHCVPHPWMKGKVTVTDTDGTTPSPTPEPTVDVDDKKEGDGEMTIPQKLIIAAIIIFFFAGFGITVAFIMGGQSRPQK